AAGVRVVIGARGAAVVGDDDTGGGCDGAVRARVLGLHTSVDLAVLGGAEVVPGAAIERGHRVAPGRDRLRLERLHRPGRRHLGRHDTAEVVLDTDDVHDLHVTVNGTQPHVAAVM